MECPICLNARQVSWCSWKLKEVCTKSTWRIPFSPGSLSVRPSFHRLVHEDQASSKQFQQTITWRIFSLPANPKEEIVSSQQENFFGGEDSNDRSEELHAEPLKSNELKSLLADSERAKLVRKLSEANQQNRFLKRKLHAMENLFVNFKDQLATVEFEIQALVKLAEEIASYGIPENSRKINGKYIQSCLLSRLEAVSDKLRDQINDVCAAQSKEVPLFWYGMAESVQVMGTFDGWSQGEHLSPEYTGSYTQFSTTLMLRPGRYEIKFLVDGQWKLSPEFPTVGDGAMENNLLIVE